MTDKPTLIPSPLIRLTRELSGHKDEWNSWPADELCELAIERGYLCAAHKKILIEELNIWMHIIFNSSKQQKWAMALQDDRYKWVAKITPIIKSLPEQK